MAPTKRAERVPDLFLKLAEDFRRLLEFDQRPQLGEDVAPIQHDLLPDHESLNVYPVFCSIGKRFQHDQIFGGTGAPQGVVGELKIARAVHDGFFKCQPAECDIQSNARFGSEL